LKRTRWELEEKLTWGGRDARLGAKIEVFKSQQLTNFPKKEGWLAKNHSFQVINQRPGLKGQVGKKSLPK